MEGKTSIKGVIKYAGVFIAFMMGSGFATGQEIMQFFTSYGIYSIGGAIISMVLFSSMSAILMRFGFRERNNPDTNAFHYYCGAIFGKFLEWFIPIFLFMVVVVMISGSGATMNQYFGTPQIIGTLIMAIIVLITNYFGLEKIIDIIGYLGPVTIIFTLVISVAALIKNPAGLSNVSEAMANMQDMPMATSSQNTWWLAGILYVAYNVTGSIPFLTEMGKTANIKNEAILGGLIGGATLILAGLLLNLALLSYIEDVADLKIPNLFLADLISPVSSFIFSIILICGIFSTASPMMWIVVQKFGGKERTQRSKIVLVIVTLIAFIGG